MEWCSIYCIGDEGSWRRGAVGSRLWTCDNGHVLDSGVVWRRGGIDGRPDKVNALILVLKIRRQKTTPEAALERAHVVPTESSLDRFVLSAHR